MEPTLSRDVQNTLLVSMAYLTSDSTSPRLQPALRKQSHLSHPGFSERLSEAQMRGRWLAFSALALVVAIDIGRGAGQALAQSPPPTGFSLGIRAGMAARSSHRMVRSAARTRSRMRTMRIRRTARRRPARRRWLARRIRSIPQLRWPARRSPGRWLARITRIRRALRTTPTVREVPATLIPPATHQVPAAPLHAERVGHPSMTSIMAGTHTMSRTRHTAPGLRLR